MLHVCDTLSVLTTLLRHVRYGGLDASEQKKAGRIAIKLLSTAGTGFFYTATKNVRKSTGKMALRKVCGELLILY